MHKHKPTHKPSFIKKKLEFFPIVVYKMAFFFFIFFSFEKILLLWVGLRVLLRLNYQKRGRVRHINILNKMETVYAVINKGKKFGTIDNYCFTTDKILSIVNKYLKQGRANLIVDTEDTLMYKINLYKDENFTA